MNSKVDGKVQKGCATGKPLNMLKAPCKVNLGLRIVGRRPDGYHLLESLFWPLNFSDTLSIRPGDRASVRCTWAPGAPFGENSLPQDSENLVGKLLAGKAGWLPKERYEVQISKVLPIGGGLGGGSSDVGAVLKYFLSVGAIDRSQALKAAVSLGADVPFFLNPVPTWVTGIGEELTSIQPAPDLLKKLFFLLVVLPFSTFTKKVFDAYKSRAQEFSEKTFFDTTTAVSFDTMLAYLAKTGNDLEPIVRMQSEPIAKVLDQLKMTPCIFSSLSGSGSTCFAIYRSFEERQKAAKDIQTICRSYSCRIIPAETYCSDA